MAELTAATAQRARGGKVVAVLPAASLPGVARWVAGTLGGDWLDENAASMHFNSTPPPIVPEAVQQAMDDSWERAMYAKRYLQEARPPTLKPTWTTGLAVAGLGLLAYRFPKTATVFGVFTAAPLGYWGYEVSRCGGADQCVMRPYIDTMHRQRTRVREVYKQLFDVPTN